MKMNEVDLVFETKNLEIKMRIITQKQQGETQTRIAFCGCSGYGKGVVKL
jgi:hypothetical protein